MFKLALLGKNIGHSKSPSIYKNLLKDSLVYTLYDIENSAEIPSLNDIFNYSSGLSITAPYKRVFLDQVKAEDEIVSLRAINCIGLDKDGSYVATNTDYMAVKEILTEILKERPNLLPVILGDGAMAHITFKVFDLWNMNYHYHSRKKDNNFSQLNINALYENIGRPLLIINACGRSYQYMGDLPGNCIFWDYNYSFKPHDHIKNQCHYIDGEDLLYRQAVWALRFWEIIE